MRYIGKVEEDDSVLVVLESSEVADINECFKLANDYFSEDEIAEKLGLSTAEVNDMRQRIAELSIEE